MNNDLKSLDSEYPKELGAFERLVNFAIKISDSSGGIRTTNLGIQSTKIYTRITLSAMTINATLPENKVSGTRLWDFPSVAVLTRAFIETCHRYFYLVQPGLSEVESGFRLKLFYYHMNSEKYRLYKEFGASQEILRPFEENLPQSRLEVMSSPIYSELSKNKAEKVRSGNAEMHLSDDEVAAEFSLIGGAFKPIYRLLSNHSHGSPFATYTQSNERGRGIENAAEKSYLVLMLKLLNRYLSCAIISQISLLSLESTNREGYLYAKEIFSAERT